MKKKLLMLSSVIALCGLLSCSIICDRDNKLHVVSADDIDISSYQSFSFDYDVSDTFDEQSASDTSGYYQETGYYIYNMYYNIHFDLTIFYKSSVDYFVKFNNVYLEQNSYVFMFTPSYVQENGAVEYVSKRFVDSYVVDYIISGNQLYLSNSNIECYIVFDNRNGSFDDIIFGYNLNIPFLTQKSNSSGKNVEVFFNETFSNVFTFGFQELTDSVESNINYIFEVNGTFQQGYNSGYLVGYDNGELNGYNNGFNDGYNDGFNADSTVASVFNGILNVALVPINFLLACFNFEILGINLSGVVSALLTICVIIIVFKLITGKKIN